MQDLSTKTGKNGHNDRKTKGIEIPERPFRRPLTTAEFAEFLSTSQRTVRRLIARGELKASRVSPRVLRILPEQAEEFLEGLITNPVTEPSERS